MCARASDWKLDSWASAGAGAVIHSLEREVDHGSLLFCRSSGAGCRLCRGGPILPAAARHFGVSDSFAIKLVRRKRHFGSPTPARQGRPPGRGKLGPYETFLIQAVEAKPAITMPELAARLLEEHGIVAAPAMLSRFLCRRGFT